jgi:hypothetical protein
VRVAGLTLIRFRKLQHLNTRLPSRGREGYGQPYLSERFRHAGVPTLGTPSTWCSARQGPFQGAWQRDLLLGGCWRFLPLSEQDRSMGSGEGSKHLTTVEALRPWFVCCTRCVFGCGGLQALLRLYPLHAARSVGVSQIGTCALVVLFISCLMERSVRMC